MPLVFFFAFQMLHLKLDSNAHHLDLTNLSGPVCDCAAPFLQQQQQRHGADGCALSQPATATPTGDWASRPVGRPAATGEHAGGGSATAAARAEAGRPGHHPCGSAATAGAGTGSRAGRGVRRLTSVNHS